MVKTLKNLFHQNQESFGAEPWYLASSTEGLLSLFKDDHELSFDFLRRGQICVAIHLYGEKVEQSFSKSIKTNG